MSWLFPSRRRCRALVETCSCVALTLQVFSMAVAAGSGPVNQPENRVARQFPCFFL